MTKHFLSILLLFFFRISYGQTSLYRPFPLTYGTWNYQYFDDFGQPTSNFNLYVLNGDTLISGVVYSKVYFANSFVGGIRENNRIIYFYPDTSATEYELYNFNLNLGDMVVHPFGGSVCLNDTVIVDYVDSVLTVDGYRRQLHFNSWTIWIEGVGSLNYLLQPLQLYCVSGNDQLSCMVGDTSTVYNPQFSSCITNLTDIAHLSGVDLFPNPAKFQINFKLKDFSDKKDLLMVFDVQGVLVFKSSFNNNDELILNCSTFSKGVYLYKIVAEKSYDYGKFVVE